MECFFLGSVGLFGGFFNFGCFCFEYFINIRVINMYLCWIFSICLTFVVILGVLVIFDWEGLEWLLSVVWVVCGELNGVFIVIVLNFICVFILWRVLICWKGTEVGWAIGVIIIFEFRSFIELGLIFEVDVCFFVFWRVIVGLNMGLDIEIV